MKIFLKFQKLLERFRESQLWSILKNKYVLTFVIFLLWLMFFDQNNIIERWKITREYNQLLEEQEYYTTKIQEDSKRILELKTDNENLEKFAREQYLMKRDNEDIYLIIDK